VAALNQDGTVWSGSINNDYTDLYVPGAQIYSSVPGNKYDYKSGSSMAAAFATGLAANALGGIKDSNADGRISDELLTALQAATTGLKK
jgi:subtilisin family serine protease